jgi:hypothetical protein
LQDKALNTRENANPNFAVGVLSTLAHICGNVFWERILGTRKNTGRSLGRNDGLRMGIRALAPFYDCPDTTFYYERSNSHAEAIIEREALSFGPAQAPATERATEKSVAEGLCHPCPFF